MIAAALMILALQAAPVSSAAIPAPAVAGPAAGGWLDEDVARRVRRNPPLGPVPPDPTNRWADDDAAARLGHRLFFDPGMSASGTVSCASCHDPAFGFADRRVIAVGEGTGTRHSMTVVNAAHQRWLTWDGRADTLWGQATQPFETATEHGFDRRRVVAHVSADPGLRAAWRAAFAADPPPGDAPAADIDRAFAMAGKAIAAYERRLVTGPSAYDRWWTRRAAGDPRADEELTDAQRRGLVLFFGKAGCAQCHHGALFSDGEFHMIGAPVPGGGPPRDPGRYAVVDRVRDDPMNAAGPHSDARDGAQARISRSLVNSPDRWGEFRTPSLRNVAQTPPYMHAGQLATLADVVRFYSTLEGASALDHHRESVIRPLGLSDAERADLEAFLGSLTGSLPPSPWGAAPVRGTGELR
jgi:cytochrome c peroxidase